MFYDFLSTVYLVDLWRMEEKFLLSLAAQSLFPSFLIRSFDSVGLSDICYTPLSCLCHAAYLIRDRRKRISCVIVGSIDGLTRGRAAGTEAGRNKGLSAEDITANVIDDIQRIEKLEVLVL